MDLDNPSLVGNSPALKEGTLGQVVGTLEQAVGTLGLAVGNPGQLDTPEVVVQNPHLVVRSPELEDSLHRQQQDMESSSWRAQQEFGAISCLCTDDLLHVGVTQDS